MGIWGHWVEWCLLFGEVILVAEAEGGGPGGGIFGSVVEPIAPGWMIAYMIILRLEKRSPLENVYNILALDELTGLLQISSQFEIVIDILLYFIYFDSGKWVVYKKS